jgi:hypothetical protein
MVKDNKNAFIGMNVETLFKNTIVDYPSIIELLKEKFSIQGRFLNANKSGIMGEKSDVRLSFACGHHIDVNIKAYKKSASFNQLTRTTLNKFTELFNISPEKKNELEHLITEKARDTKNNSLFPTSYQKEWFDFFEKNVNEILKWGFSFTKSREILALFERDSDTFRLYMMKDVLSKLNKDISISKKGNINIGNCISFQRKGGNGSLSKTIPKTSIKHPGNNVQLKINSVKFISEMENHLLKSYSI